MPAAGVWGCWARAWDQALGPAGEGKAEAATVAWQARVMACPVQIRSGLARAWQPAGVPQNRALMPGRVTPQITVQAGRAAAWWARVIKARGPLVVTAARSAAPPLAGLAGAVVAVPGSANAAPAAWATSGAGTALARCQ